MEIVLCIVLFFCMIGLGFYIAKKSFSKNIKSFDFSLVKNEWIKIYYEFYKEDFFIIKFTIIYDKSERAGEEAYCSFTIMKTNFLTIKYAFSPDTSFYILIQF